MRAVVAIFLLLLASSVAVAAPKCSFESVVRFAEAESAETSLPANFAEALGFPNAELKVRRLGYQQVSADKTYRVIDIVPGIRDLVLFIRKDNTIIFWRVSSSGQIRMTAVADANRLDRRNNATYAAEYAELHDSFCDIIEDAKKKDKPASGN